MQEIDRLEDKLRGECVAVRKHILGLFFLFPFHLVHSSRMLISMSCNNLSPLFVIVVLISETIDNADHTKHVETRR